MKSFLKVLALLSFAISAAPSFAQMNLVLLGPPGSGKGTVAVRLKEKYGIPHISSGDIVRAEMAAGTPFGLKVKEMMNAGQLLPDTPEFMGLLFDAVKTRLSQEDCKKGFILDGIPRTQWQAGKLNEVLSSIGKRVDAAVLLDVSRDTLIKRLTGRMICKGCTLSYHSELQPPKTAGKCDKCCQALTIRPDDKEEVALSRLDIYDKEISPILEYYKTEKLLLPLSGEGTPESVFVAPSRRRERTPVAPSIVRRRDYPRDYLKTQIAKYPHPTQAGLQIYNLIEMYKDTGLIQEITHRFSQTIRGMNPDYVAAPEARALPIFGAILHNLGKPGIFIRKTGKIPAAAPKHAVTYKTAYSDDSIEMTADANLRGKTVVVIDDGISSGGATLATIELLQKAGMKVVGVLAVVQHNYRKKVSEYAPWEPLTYTLFDL